MNHILLLDKCFDDSLCIKRGLKHSGLDASLACVVTVADAMALLERPEPRFKLVLITTSAREIISEKLELIPQMRAIPELRSIPVVAILSEGYGTGPVIANAVEMGANGVIDLPIDYDEAIKSLSTMYHYWLTSDISTPRPELKASPSDSPVDSK